MSKHTQARDDWLSMSYKKRRAFTLKLIQIYGAVCCICGLPITPGTESTQHIPPRSKGGITSIETCRPAHRRCNYQAQDKLIDPLSNITHTGLTNFINQSR